MSEVLTHKVPMKHRLDAHIQDVQIAAPANNEVLTYETATELWKNKPPAGGVPNAADIWIQLVKA